MKELEQWHIITMSASKRDNDSALAQTIDSWYQRMTRDEALEKANELESAGLPVERAGPLFVQTDGLRWYPPESNPEPKPPPRSFLP